MAVLKVLKYPDPILQTKAKPVTEITEADRKLVSDMIDTMYAEKGVGLAANQVGILKRIFVASPDQVRGKELVFLNPEIVRSEGNIRESEGCLSVPEYYETVNRAKRVKLRAMNLDGQMVEVDAVDMLARIFQHETDHLNGILFIDRLGLLKKKLVRRSLSRKK